MGRKHNYIYLGKAISEETIYKVGLTTQTCYARCNYSDYIIGVGINIFFTPWTTLTDNPLRECEKFIINYFNNNFSLAYGKEYFEIKNYKWEEIKKIFIAEMVKFLNENNCWYSIHEGWVEPYTY